MHKIKNNPISNDDVVNKQYVDDSILDKQINMIRASEHYVVALTDESKVVLATFKK